MYTLTIDGNTPEELFANLEKMAATNKGVAPVTAPQPTPQQQPVNPTQLTAPAANAYAMPPMAQPPIAAPTAPAVPAVANVPTAPAQTYTPPTPATPAANPMPAVPASAPTYTLDALARAGATLAQSGKMQEALALLARYGVQTVNQLKPEQYGAFATELRALGAQV